MKISRMFLFLVMSLCVLPLSIVAGQFSDDLDRIRKQGEQDLEKIATQYKNTVTKQENKKNKEKNRFKQEYVMILPQPIYDNTMQARRRKREGLVWAIENSPAPTINEQATAISSLLGGMAGTALIAISLIVHCTGNKTTSTNALIALGLGGGVASVNALVYGIPSTITFIKKLEEREQHIKILKKYDKKTALIFPEGTQVVFKNKK